MLTAAPTLAEQVLLVCTIRRPLGAKEIAAALDPRPSPLYLRRILARLVRRGRLVHPDGRNGGYTLAEKGGRP